MEQANIFFLSLLFMTIGYFNGNILFGLLISKIKKIDLRSQGSGNVGATNTSRILGKPIGILVLICDMLKGWMVVFVSSIIYQTLGHSLLSQQNYQKFGWIIYISGLFVVIGHCFPVFYIYALFKFKFDLSLAKSFSGGKGAAPTAGVFTAISPWIFLLAFLVFNIIFLTFRYVSLSSMIAISTVFIFILIPRLDYFYILSILNINPILDIPSVNEAYLIDNVISYQNTWPYILSLVLISFGISTIVVYKHKDNIKRLINKTEKPLFEWKKQTINK